MQKINLKLLKFRSLSEVIKKDADNPYFKSKYADLPSILDSIKDHLVACELSIVHNSLFENGSLVLKTTITDCESGEEISSIFPIYGSKPQEIGSSISYARRYNIQALLDLAVDDDDGNQANKSKPVKALPKFGEQQLKEIEKCIADGVVQSKKELKLKMKEFSYTQQDITKIQELISQFPSLFIE